MHAGKEIAVDDVGRVAVHDGLLVGLLGVGLPGGDKGRADVGQVRPHGLGRENAAAGRNGSR